MADRETLIRPYCIWRFVKGVTSNDKPLKTVSIYEDTWRRLWDAKRGRETLADVVERLVGVDSVDAKGSSEGNGGSFRAHA